MMIYFFERNMKSRILVFLLFALSSLSQLCGQDRFTLSGRVTDENGDPVELATVHIEKQLIGAMTDFNGKYRISAASSDSVVVVFSMVGYNTRKRILRYPVGDLTLNVVLPNTGYELGEVTITESRRQTGQTQQLTLDNNRLVPDASGGSIESFIATQAGVSSNNELSSQYNVRGGSYDENIVYVNGVEVYRPLLVRAGQQEGLSFINPDMVESVGFSAGGFEAKYGDKMASVLDITYKKPEAFEGSASLSLLGGSVYAGYGNDKFSFSNGVRYKTNRYLLGSLDVKGEYDPNFIDYQAYITYSPAKNLEFGFIGNFSQNSYNFIPADRTTKFGTMTDMREFKVYFDGQEKDLFRTFFGSLSMKYRINEKNDVSFLFSTFKTREDETFDIRGEYWLNALDDEEEGDMLSSEGQTQGIGTYMEHARNYLNANVQSYTLTGTHRLKHNNTLVWGLELKHEAISERLREWELRDSAGYSLPFVPDEVNLIYNMNSNNSISSNRLSFYLQDTYKFHTQAGMFTLNAGVRGSYWNFNREFILSPRVSLGMIPSFNEDFTFRDHYGERQCRDNPEQKHKVAAVGTLRTCRRLQVPGARTSVQVHRRGLLQTLVKPHPLQRRQRAHQLLRQKPVARICGGARHETVRRIRARHRLMAHTVCHEDTGEAERPLDSAPHRPAVQPVVLLHRLFHAQRPLETQSQSLSGRRSAFRPAAYGAGRSRIPCSGLQEDRRGHVIQDTEQRRRTHEGTCRQMLQEYMAGHRSFQPVQHVECQLVLLGHRCLRPTVCRAQLPHLAPAQCTVVV